MCKIKVGDKVQIIGNTRIHHHLAVPSTAEIIGMDSTGVKVFGYGNDKRICVQWVSFVDIRTIRKAVVL
mgnify:CR=1 FL=1